MQKQYSDLLGSYQPTDRRGLRPAYGHYAAILGKDRARQPRRRGCALCQAQGEGRRLRGTEKLTPIFRLLSPRDLSDSGPHAKLSGNLPDGGLLLLAPARRGQGDVCARQCRGGDQGSGLSPSPGPKPFVDIVCPLMQQQAEAAWPAADALRAADLEGEPLQSAARSAPRARKASPSSCRRRPPIAGSTIRSSRKRRSSIRQACSPICARSSAISVWRLRPITPAPSGCGPGSRATADCPARPQAYVEFVTGRAAEEWKLPETELPDALKSRRRGRAGIVPKLAPLVVRAVYETEPLTASGAWRPWGVHVSTAFSKAKALAQFARLKGRYRLGARRPRSLRAARTESEPRAPLPLHGADRRRQPRRRRQALRQAAGGRRRLHRAEKLSQIARPGRNVSVATSERWYKVRSGARARAGTSDAHHLRDQIGRAEAPRPASRRSPSRRSGSTSSIPRRRRRRRSSRRSRSTSRRARSSRRSRCRAASIRRTARIS